MNLLRYKQTAPKGATLFFISPWIFQITKVLRIILLKTTPFSPFIKGDFSDRLLNLMTLGCKPDNHIEGTSERTLHGKMEDTVKGDC
ncbi:hypothetical protein KsCSTR_34400 [Candidatus Kuenenia stuttgartiensis]|uniref:Uncharacterized protein n=1 Tax=Kuenenia stuttgartiensis TaxID=174633 RepID=Q1Q463_KUEST|nr:hypothetical protein KsCSTR_34400 [Candidatus Kuenenia stuttgartiensis]CAJ74803.1 unknown protein [Candidatus Kuenenia stuttgartiensis]